MATTVNLPSDTYGPIVRGDEYEATFSFAFDISGYSAWAAEAAEFAGSTNRVAFAVDVSDDDVSIALDDEQTASMGNKWVWDLQAIPPGGTTSRTLFRGAVTTVAQVTDD